MEAVKEATYKVSAWGVGDDKWPTVIRSVSTFDESVAYELAEKWEQFLGNEWDGRYIIAVVELAKWDGECYQVVQATEY